MRSLSSFTLKSLTGLLLLVCLSCTSPPKEKVLNFSGFLGDYSGFRPSPDGSGSWTYQRPALDLTPYRTLMVDPLVVWNNPDPQKGGINPVDLWQLQLTFRDRIVKALGNGFPVVDHPGPHVLRLRAALTDVMGTRPHSNLNAPGPLLPLVNDLLVQSTETLTSTRFLIGQATLEAELLNSQTGERLIGYIENRESSGTYVSDNPHDLGPIVEIFDYWAQKLRHRLESGRK